MVHHLKTIRTRLIRPTCGENILLFTDGAYEDERGSIGAVLFHPTRGVHSFGLRVENDIIKHWQRHGKNQIIGFLEIVLVILAKMVFQEVIAGGNLTIFVDNDGARHQLINGYATDKDIAHLLDMNALTDAQMGCLCWVTRVPTSANPADAPSRLK